MRAFTRTALLLFAVLTIYPVEASPRILKFANGEIIVETGREFDLVVVNDSSRGEQISKSWCKAGTFESYFELLTDIKAALDRRDCAAVVKLVGYPLEVNTKRRFSIKNPAALTQSYDLVFTPNVITRVLEAEPAAVFCQDGMGMIGDGVIWASSSRKSAKVMVVNP